MTAVNSIVTAESTRLLTVAEACAELRISRWMFYRLLHDGQLRTIKLGTRRLVPISGLQQLIALHESDKADS